MSSTRPEASEYAEPLVMVMGQRRRRNLFGARNLLSLVALLGLCVASASLAAGGASSWWTPWRSEGDERGFLIATVAVQACVTISGMIVAHTVLSQPPLRGPRVMAQRLGTYFLIMIPAAVILAIGGAVGEEPLPIPRLIVAMVATYPLCVLIINLLLAPLLLRQWAWAVTFLTLATWMILGLVVGTTRASAPTTVVATASGLPSLFDTATLDSILTLGCCFWSGAAIAALGNLVDSHGPVVRGLVPPMAAIGTLIYLPQMLTGASVGHIMLATALAPLVDVDLPRFLTEHDVGFGILTLGWITGAAGSLLITGSITAMWCAVCAVGIGVPLSFLCGHLLGRSRNLHEGLHHNGGTAPGPASRRAQAAPAEGPAIGPDGRALPGRRRRFVADREGAHWEDLP